MAHTLRVLKSKSEEDGMEERCNLCYWVGRCLQADGRIKEAIIWLGECYSWRKGHFPKDHPDRLASQHQLAIAYQANGQTKEAIALIEEVVAIQAKTLAKDHPDRLASQHQLAITYDANGQTKEAIALIEEVVAIRARPPPKTALTGSHHSTCSLLPIKSMAKPKRPSY